jgi:Protein of unknown function (DUF3761)
VQALLSLLVAAGLVALPLRTSAPDVGAYTQHVTWLRAAPAPEGKTLALMPEGTPVRLGECAGDWCAAKFRNLRGFVEAAVVASAAPLAPIDAGRGYINVHGVWIPSPVWTVSGEAPPGATAQCADGAFSFSQSASGTCSHHGGVRAWL